MELLNKKIGLMPDSAKVDESRYNELESLVKMCEIVSNLTNQSVCLTDYIRQTLPYISSQLLFLCGYTREEVQEMGYSFIETIVPPEDYEMIVEIVQMFWKFWFNLPDTNKEKENQIRMSYDFHIRHKNGNKILVNQKVSPLLFADDGTPWINMCILNYSAHKKAGNVAFNFKNENLYYRYDFEKKELEPYIPEKLSRREEDIIRLSIQGYTETDIAKQLSISIHTVRNHRYNAERKLGVNNMVNAVAMFSSVI